VEATVAHSFIDPYTGKDTETCSYSVQQQVKLAGTTGSPQTEAEFNKSKQLGEWGVITAKLAKGEIPDGTKVLTYTKNDGRGYLYVKHGQLYKKVYTDGYDPVDKPTPIGLGEVIIKSGYYKSAIPKATDPAAAAKPEPVPLTNKELAALVKKQLKDAFQDGEVVAVQANGDYLQYDQKEDVFNLMSPDPNGGPPVVVQPYAYVDSPLETGDWFAPDNRPSTPNATPKKAPEATPATTQIAAPTPAPAVTPGSTSVGSMSHEDVAAMFVKIKDDLAKEQGLNIKGANPALDQVVYGKIGAATGYTAAEVKAKIDAYKAEGNKLSALKKKVLAGTKQVPQGTAQPTKATPAAPLNVGKATNKPVVDPKPNGVPTTATPKLADAIKADVKATVNAAPTKVYTDEDIAAQYVIAKDAIVASNTNGWTLYTKNDDFEAQIYDAIKFTTGYSKAQAQGAIANYLGGGKKLSVLKKQLIKQGALKPQADTLKKSGAAKDAASKAKDVSAKADAGYTPTPTPSTAVKPPGSKAAAGDAAVKTDTGRAAPKAVVKEAEEFGDISKLPDSFKHTVFNTFKGTSSKSWLSSGPGANYEGFKATQAKHPELTLLQLIRIADEQGAKKAGVENGHLFEKQVATWLTTPEGTQYVKEAEVKLAKEAAEAAAKAAKKAEAEKLAKQLQDNQPPLPADSALFQEMTPAKAQIFQDQMLAAKPFGSGEKSGLQHYTGSAYTEMNRYLRGQSSKIGTRSKQAIDQASRGMRPSPEPMLLRRGTGFIQFGPEIDASTIWSITGKTFEDKGFLSTSAAGRAAFGGQVAMEIEAPAGTPGMWVDNFSKHRGENEWLLDKGTKMKVLNVRKVGSTFVVRLRVVND
jgi:hypothetical protein